MSAVFSEPYFFNFFLGFGCSTTVLALFNFPLDVDGEG